MSIQKMHYDFKRKLNKISSEQNRNLLVPEIDVYLNEALEVFIKIIAMPRDKQIRLSQYKGFENGQRTIDDIKPLIVNNTTIAVVNNVGVLPVNYMYYLRSEAIINKGTCTNKKARVKIRKYDEDFTNGEFDKSSFEWRFVNALFINNGVEFYPTDFTVSQFIMSYIKKPLYIHNASAFNNITGYTLPDGTVLTGTQNCELPTTTHNEIVDIAVLIATGELQIPDYSFKMNKINLTN